jgi:hypothetical protein
MGRIAERGMPKPSKVLMYMMLRPLPPSINTLVRRFDPTIGSTVRGYILGCGIMSGWSWWSKIIENSDHRRYRGTAGSTTNTSRWATLRQRRSPYASPPPKIIRHPVVSGNYSVGASYLASFVGSSCFAFLAGGLDMKCFRSSHSWSLWRTIK